MLYQGEDITIRLTGDEVVDFVSNSFKVLIYPNSRGGSEQMVLGKEKFTRVDGENSYTHVISHDTSKSMQGSYNMEVMIEQDRGYRTIFKQNNVFAVEACKIKDK